MLNPTLLPTVNVMVLMVLLICGWVAGMVLAPVMANFLYHFHFWKKKPRTTAVDGQVMTIAAASYEHNETKTPRAGGLMIWITVLFLAAIFWLLAQIWPHSFFAALNFITRSQTWLPLFTLLMGGIIGFVDDWMVVNQGGTYSGGGLSFWQRLFFVTVVGLLGASWFYFKLDWSSIAIPFYGLIDLGWIFIPFFILVMLGVFSSGVIDGVDGLSGGVFATIFLSYAALAVVREQYQLAGLCFVIVGVLVAYLWFNIPPARFFMGETGILALSLTLTVVAFLTNGVILLPIIAVILVAESGSVIIQLLSKKFRHGKKVFLSAPLHHHFQGLGWSSPKVTMRFWLLSAMGGLIGVAISLLSGVLN